MYMILGKNESTEDIVVRLLSKEEKDIKQLQTILKNEYGKKITIQGIYKIAKNLVRSGVLIKKGTIFTTNKEWAKEVVDYFDWETSPLFAESESATYAFKSLSALDAYWKHTIVQLHKELKKYPIFFYNNHVVWVHVRDRKESEIAYLNSFDTEKKYAYFTVGGNTALDMDFKKSFNKKYLQVKLKSIDAIKYDSITVHGDYIITVKFKKNTTNLIDTLYKESKSVAELETKLDNSTKNNLPIKFTIERNKQKAIKIRRLLSADFYIPKELKDEFKLLL